eukprot:361889-Chlamydomonas_euryale.AAC.1
MQGGCKAVLAEPLTYVGVGEHAQVVQSGHAGVEAASLESNEAGPDGNRHDALAGVQLGQQVGGVHGVSHVLVRRRQVRPLPESLQVPEAGDGVPCRHVGGDAPSHAGRPLLAMRAQRQHGCQQCYQQHMEQPPHAAHGSCPGVKHGHAACSKSQCHDCRRTQCKYSTANTATRQGGRAAATEVQSAFTRTRHTLLIRDLGPNLGLEISKTEFNGRSQNSQPDAPNWDWTKKESNTVSPSWKSSR